MTEHARDYTAIAFKYAKDVVSGKIVAGRLMKLACKRQLDDLDRREGPNWQYHFDEWHGDDVCDFIEKLPHVEGAWAKPTIELEPPQIFMLNTIFGWRKKDGNRRFTTVHIEVARKAAKAENIENLIPTPRGFVRMGDLHPGDFVYGSDGKPTRIVAVTEPMLDRRCAEVELSTGERIVVAMDHLWRVNQTINSENMKKSWGADDALLRAAYPLGGINAAMAALPHRSRHALNKRAGTLGLSTGGRKFRETTRLETPRVMTMPEPADVLSTETLAATLTYGARGDLRYSIDVGAPVQNPDIDLPIPPYTLGAWLGDGTSASAHLTSAYADSEVVDSIRAEGVTCEERKSSNLNTGLYVLGSNGRGAAARKLSLQAKMREIGLLNAKHIPAIYFRASFAQRLELLRGLMDTDGTIGVRGDCSFSNTNARLAEDVRVLACSLGLKATTQEGQAKLNGVYVSQHYRVRFNPPAGLRVFHLTRKADRQVQRGLKTRSDTRMIAAIREVPSVPVKCIQVENADGIYLTGTSYVPTHNSTLTAGVGIYCLTCEGEIGPQVIIGATTGEQAGKVFNPAKLMIDRTPALQEAFGLETYSRSISCEVNGGYMQPINAKGKTQDGWNPHVGILDELHAHKDRSLFDVIRSAFGSRKNPLFWIITTAGFDTNGVCYEHRSSAIKMLEGVARLDHLFAAIFTLDEGDDPFDEKNWIKANPMIGVTPTFDMMRNASADAQVSPSSEGNFKTKNLNIWMNAMSAWLNVAQWNLCADEALDWKDFEGLDCYIGGDLADKNDMTALVLAAFDTKGRLIFKPRFWLPETVLLHPDHAEGRGNAPYRTWSKGDDAPLTLSSGDWVDHGEVEKVVRNWIKRFSVKKVTFDQFGAAQLMASRLNEDLATPDNPLAQILHKSAKTVSDAAKELEARVKVGASKLRHDGNPIMTWMASNCVVARRRDETILPIKETPMSPNKIDGIDALVNAIQPALLVQEREVKPAFQMIFV